MTVVAPVDRMRADAGAARLVRFQARSPLGRSLVRYRKEILDLAAARGIRNVRVFGSVARGSDRPSSDVDLLADLPEDIGLFELARLEGAISDLVGADVDLVPANSLRAHLADDVLREAVPL